MSGANNDWNVQSGEIDQETGIFYWASTDPQGRSSLYTVDLATAKATKIGDFMHNEQVAMLTIPKETVKDAAPALASGMSLAFDKASLTGKVCIHRRQPLGFAQLCGEHRRQAGKEWNSQRRTESGGGADREARHPLCCGMLL